MLVSIYCKDAPGGAEHRQGKMVEHLEHIEEIEERIKVAGPVMGPDGEGPVASLLIFDVGSLDEATAMLHADPYYQAGVWQEINIREFKGVVGSWVGGKTW
jgi:uncharacterized protein YciI